MIDFKSATCKICETKIVTSTSDSFSCACSFVTCMRCGIVKESNYCKECDKEKPRQMMSGSWSSGPTYNVNTASYAPASVSSTLNSGSFTVRKRDNKANGG